MAADVRAMSCGPRTLRVNLNWIHPSELLLRRILIIFAENKKCPWNYIFNFSCLLYNGTAVSVDLIWKPKGWYKTLKIYLHA